MGIEWLREGMPWTGNDDFELRAKLAESGVIGPGRSGGLRLRFVGVVIFRNRTMVVLPKIHCNRSPIIVHRQVLKAMRRYKKWTPTHHEPSPYLNESPDSGLVSGLAAADWMIRDYADHGLFRRTETTYENSGSGISNWRRTVESIAPVITNGRPVYLDTVTRRADADNRNFATVLHRHLLETLSTEYAEVLDLKPVVLDHEPVERLDAMPSIEECEARLGAEQRVTYSQRGLELLAMMIATVKAIEIETARGLSLYGTSHFHHVWEAVCASVFGNDVQEWLPHLPRPHWTSASGHIDYHDTFIPDLITPVTADEILIGDAKYYRPVMPPALHGVPGVNDVAKQIWYKQMLGPEATRRGYTHIQNAFLFPADVDDLTLLGHVELPAGGERVDAIAVPFMPGLSAYTGDRPHDAATWRTGLLDLVTRTS